MAFPNLLKRLFDSNGAGVKLNGGIMPYSTSSPKAAGTASPGTSDTVARGDHIHPAQTAISGNAGTATRLENKRTIDGMQFDGSANIHHYASCSTAAGTAEKAVTLAGFTLATGARIIVRFTVTNSAANPTLNVNSTGAKPIQYRNAAISAGHLAANRVYEFVYDGSYWQIVGDLIAELQAQIDPWTVFPPRLPVAIDGVTFGGSDGRRAIMPGETEAREDWILCDGGSDGKGGTVPDLRGRMILGASDEHEAGSTGGSETHTHSISGTVGDTTLSVEQIASHGHTYNFQHGKRDCAFASDPTMGFWLNTKTANTGATGGSQSHTHSLSGVKSGAAGSLPPYYAGHYVIRV